MHDFPLGIQEWLEAYSLHGHRPSALIAQLLESLDANDVAWIYRCKMIDITQQINYVEQQNFNDLPLYGVPFVVKDNIDLAFIPTTAGCPAFAYTPNESALVVERLLKAGAICIGKANLDQFATGLVGARSPFGAVPNSFDPEYVSGGSSSGSAVIVAKGIVPFSLGTDTAGSGRVPAGLNNIVGLKASPGSIPMKGVVPACLTLDVVSIFALTVPDASLVMSIMEGAEHEPKYQNYAPAVPWLGGARQTIRLGVPSVSGCSEQLGFDLCYGEAMQLAKDKGFELVSIDMTHFYEVAELLYNGPWVAERYASIEEFIQTQPDEINSVVKEVIQSAKKYSSVDSFKARYKLELLRKECEKLWTNMDALMVPTVVTAPTFEDLSMDPIMKNSQLGQYTNFVNLLGLCALAVPHTISKSGLPFGVTFIAPNGLDAALIKTAHAWESGVTAPLGRYLRQRTHSISAVESVQSDLSVLPRSAPTIKIAVVGAHLTGMPLNSQLIERGSRLLGPTLTSPTYRLYDLANTNPKKPGLFRVGAGGVGIELEVYEMPVTNLGSFLEKIPSPLGLGKVELQSGEWVTGFICEQSGQLGARDISEFGGWRKYLAFLQGETRSNHSEKFDD